MEHLIKNAIITSSNRIISFPQKIIPHFSCNACFARSSDEGSAACAQQSLLKKLTTKPTKCQTFNGRQVLIDLKIII